MTAFKLITPPAAEPVTLDDVKLHARIDTAADDAFVATLIGAAREWAEAYTSRAFITQTWQLWLDPHPGAGREVWDGVREGAVTVLSRDRSIALPRPPLIAVTSVKYYDESDAETVWDPANYVVDTVSAPGRIALRSGAVWPPATRSVNAIGIQYTAGYGSEGSAVPAAIKTAIRQLVSHWYEHRGEAETVAARNRAEFVPLVIQSLLEPYRIKSIKV